MNKTRLLKLNKFIAGAYKSTSFPELLKYVILNLHEIVMYESGMFFCGISQDCSFFKPYIQAVDKKTIDDFYHKQEFPIMDDYLKINEQIAENKSDLVYKASDYKSGIIQIINEPRNQFLTTQQDYHIVCLRIINDEQFLGEIYLHRSKEKPDFNQEDLYQLKLIQPHITNIFGMIHLTTAVRYIETNGLFHNQKGICIFDKEMNLSGGNITGLDMLKWVTKFNSSVLYHIKEYCQEILRNEEVTRNETTKRFDYSLKLGNGKLSINLYYTININKNEPDFITVMEYLPLKKQTDDYKFKFTKREADVIDGLLQGKTNIQISNQLSISENTVRTHIKNVFHKTGVNNRTELTYMMMKT